MTKAYKTHLLERLQTLEDRVGYLRAVFEDGDSATINRAVQDVCESVNFRATTPTADDEAQALELAEYLYVNFFDKKQPAEESLVDIVSIAGHIKRALTRSRSDIIEKIEAKRDEWQHKLEDTPATFQTTRECLAESVTAANHILVMLREGGKG